jgi:putative glutamine amidotransferase
MKTLPVVALTTTSVAEGGMHQRPQISLYAAYIRSLEQAGLAPVLLTPFHSAHSIRALLEHCSGLVLSGGEDVDPKRYGEQPHPRLGSVAPERDEMEMTALGAALQSELPVLAICRGAQLLNVYFGGTLYQDIASQRPTDVHHQQQQPWGERSHEVRVKAGTKLRCIVETDTLLINSFHHQAIKDVAPGLEVTAVADDGLVESVESAEYRWVVGVQWHPERHEARAPDSDPDRRLFAAFREAVRAPTRSRA